MFIFKVYIIISKFSKQQNSQNFFYLVDNNATARVRLLELIAKYWGKLIMTFIEKRLNKTSSTKIEVHNEILG